MTASFLAHRRILLAAVAFLGVALTVFSWFLIWDAEEERLLTTFRRRAESQASFVRERVRLYEEMVHSLQNLFVSSNQVTRQEFERAVSSLRQRHPGVQALQWVAYVTPETRAEFEAQARTEYEGFMLTEMAPDGTLTHVAERPFYTAIRLVSPLAGNERALGYDNSSSPVGSELAIARRERRLIVTHPFQLIQATSPDDEHGVVFALPVFAAEPPEDNGALRGYVQGVFRVETMLGQPHRAHPDEALLLRYTDLDASPTTALLYVNLGGREIRRPESHALTRDASLPSYTEVFHLGGRRWEMFVQMNPAWSERQRTLTPSLFFLGGLLTTTIAVLALNGMLRRTQEIENQVALRTAELENAQRELQEDNRRRREAELALQTSEERLQAILDCSPAAIFVKDLQGRYLLCNREFERDCGLQRHEILNRTDVELFPADTATSFAQNDRRVFEADATLEFEETYPTPAGPRSHFVQRFPLKDTSGRTYATCGIATDMTERLNAERERRELERRLQEKQKLESLGVLAGGIAHDFNNILTAVLGNASLVRTILPADTPVTPQLLQIENAARRAADLCSQMLAYAGKGSLMPGSVNLSNLVRDTASLLEVSINKSTRLHRQLAPNLPAVHADATQIRQIVMNLVINAAEAIGDRPGDIFISTSTVEACPEELRRAIQHPDLPGGTYVAVQVRDTGGGMPPETLARIFEPFFTTKFSGRGLGLSAVLGIVRSHHGALFVESTLGIGSTFRLLLPAAAHGAPEANPDDRATTAGASGRTRLNGTVLLVEDEQHVRSVAALALRSAGLEVLEAGDGHEALQVARDPARKIDLILLDLTMPWLSGEETLRRLRMQGAQQKVILMSGYSENDATRRCMELGAVAFVQKPFELDRLLQLIAKHLG